MLQQEATMTIFLEAARDVISIFDIKQGCSAGYRCICATAHRMPKIAVGNASSIISITRSSLLDAIDGVANGCCTILYTTVIDPLSTYLAATELFGNC